jgi:hypothetical protein
MQSFGFSLPLTMSTLVTYIILFFTQGLTKDAILIGELFYLDKPQGREKEGFSEKKRERWLFLILLSTWFKTFNDFFNWIFISMVIENENNKSCLVSNIRTISNDLQVCFRNAISFD